MIHLYLLKQHLLQIILHLKPGQALNLIIDLDDNTFSSLQETGGWLNFTSENILLVRISDSEIRVFDNACPHQGNKNRWSFDGTNFTCARHGNSFGATCTGS